MESPTVKMDKSGKYGRIFKGLLLISNYSGVSILSHSNNAQKVDDMLVSGFLSAIDGLIKEGLEQGLMDDYPNCWY